MKITIEISENTVHKLKSGECAVSALRILNEAIALNETYPADGCGQEHKERLDNNLQELQSIRFVLDDLFSAARQTICREGR